MFRLQGSGADGTVSKRAVLVPDARAERARHPRTLRIGATVLEVSSEYSPAFEGANAVDGDLSSEWSSNGDGDDAFITLDLGRAVDVTAVAFRTRQMNDGTAITTFTVTVDGAVLGPFPAGTDPVPLAVSARVMRFDVESSSGGNTGAVEDRGIRHGARHALTAP